MKKILTITILLSAILINASAMTQYRVAAEPKETSLMDTVKPIATGVAGYFTIAGLIKVAAVAALHPAISATIGGVALIGYIYSKLKSNAKPEKDDPKAILRRLRTDPKYLDMIIKILNHMNPKPKKQRRKLRLNRRDSE